MLPVSPSKPGQSCSLYSQDGMFSGLGQNRIDNSQRYWPGSYSVDDFGGVAAMLMVGSSCILAMKVRAEHRSIIYGNDRLLKRFTNMLNVWGVAVVFI
jgi:hypothetical protein